MLVVVVMQAGNEMGVCVFVKKWKIGVGVLGKKKWKMGVFFCKKVDLSSTQGALCTVSVFFILHFTYLGGCVPSQCTPLPTGLVIVVYLV